MSAGVSGKGHLDRQEVLSRIALDELADDLLGGGKGTGTGRRWPSPVRSHEQTGKTPPMSIFTTRYGEQRWTCFATGASGTAIDLVMEAKGHNFRDALWFLADRAGVSEEPFDKAGRVKPAPRRAPLRLAATTPDPALEAYVSSAEAFMDHPDARGPKEWLEARGISEDLWVPNRIGYDPGPQTFPRPDGLPKYGHMIVFPVRNGEGELVYAQMRHLGISDYKYRNPASSIAVNPNVSMHPRPGAEVVVVAEGIPDALVANRAGFASVAVLGVGSSMREDIVGPIAKFASGQRLVVALDADVNGEIVESVRAKLNDAHDGPVGVLRPEVGDLSDWWLRARQELITSIADTRDDVGAALER